MLIPAGSAPGEFGLSIDATDEPRVYLDDRDPTELAFSKSAPKYFPSSLTFLLSFLLLREKNDFPPEDCLDLSDADILGFSRIVCFNHRYANGGFSIHHCPSTHCTLYRLPIWRYWGVVRNVLHGEISQHKEYSQSATPRW